MKAIVDCNNFYCSCERVFQPVLENKPVVVLSNNDGCIISRSDEAKVLGLGMAGPYFKAKPIIQQHDVAVFSSNYNLYGDMSRRVMDTLKEVIGKDNVEVYSVDEAFVDLNTIPLIEVNYVAFTIRETIEAWTGVKVSVGVAPTKTLAKLANHIAKKNKDVSKCVTVLDRDEKIAAALKNTPVADLWGVGRRYAEKLKQLGIHTAWHLYNMPEEWARTNLGGVVGIRLIKELHGEEAVVMNEELVTKKNITTTRMFGNPVTDLKDIKEAIATYTSRTAEKLRRQKSAASIITVFVVPKEEVKKSTFQPGPVISSCTILPQPTSITSELIKPALKMAEELYQQQTKYQKAGVILSGLVPDNSIQGNLFTPGSSTGRFLMDMVDNINFSMRDDVIKFGASGTKRNWKMRQQELSPRYTTRWDELCEVR
ncbi:MAG: Y-family DNA polymerase [Chitinophagaceae bacterium]